MLEIYCDLHVSGLRFPRSVTLFIPETFEDFRLFNFTDESALRCYNERSVLLHSFIYKQDSYFQWRYLDARHKPPVEVWNNVTFSTKSNYFDVLRTWCESRFRYIDEPHELFIYGTSKGRMFEVALEC